MALTTFTAGQVLTAAQVNAVQANDYNQTVSTKVASYVLVAADKGTRVVMDSATATTITVNTSLFNAGDTLFIQNIGAGVCTITAGTATVSTLGSLALDQYGSGTLYFTSAGVSIFYPSAGGASGLTLINTTTFSAVTSQSINDVFSATYDHYKIFLGVTPTSNGILKIRYRVGGTDNTTSNYSHSFVNTASNSAPVNNNFGTAQNFGGIGNHENTYLGFNEMCIFNPFVSTTTSCVFQQNQVNSNLAVTNQGSNFLNVTTSYTGFTIFPESGNLTGTVSVYGLAK
jgi:hypothetical protein